MPKIRDNICIPLNKLDKKLKIAPRLIKDIAEKIFEFCNFKRRDIPQKTSIAIIKNTTKNNGFIAVMGDLKKTKAKATKYKTKLKNLFWENFNILFI